MLKSQEEENKKLIGVLDSFSKGDTIDTSNPQIKIKDNNLSAILPNQTVQG